MDCEGWLRNRNVLGGTTAALALSSHICIRRRGEARPRGRHVGAIRRAHSRVEATKVIGRLAPRMLNRRPLRLR